MMVLSALVYGSAQARRDVVARTVGELLVGGALLAAVRSRRVRPRT